MDIELLNHGCDSRLEFSRTFGEVCDGISDVVGSEVSGHVYQREGLGDWVALSADIEDYGELFFAGPVHKHEAGCSIWYSRKDGLNHRTVATLVMALTHLNGDFLDPDTGILIEASKKRLASFIGDGNITHTDQTFVSKTSFSAIRIQEN
ncbi:hypothetical protein FDP25_02205 [Roseovarius sp. A21]|uniref:Uncharacterized protein n=1 Tax=Roseovarius bejariae TaxID=2576383 RepID=A0A844CX80_9RHOB|nr:hypothetical protein [Roseovarius bejariae]MRU14233.1 hypothetical protein [Roseovarius bejariae]